MCGHHDVIELVHSYGANLSSPDAHDAHPVHYAAQMCGHVGEESDPVLGMKVMKKLVSKGVNVTAQDQDKRQPLLWAASSGQAVIIAFFQMYIYNSS